MRPFEGIRVLDLTHVLAGPFCTFQLATLGADVIKIEPPHEPDICRYEGAVSDLHDRHLGTHFLAQNAGKRAITLNLKTEQGRDILKILARDADVLVENYTGGALQRLGLGYNELSALNPRLIYCSMTGFGHTGPKRSDPAYDVIIQAYSGVMAHNGTPETTPVRVGPAMVDYGTGAQAAFAIAAAIHQRHLTGKGQRIDVAMLDAALLLMSASTTATLTTGNAPRPHGNFDPKHAGYRTYDTADGMIMLGALSPKQMSRLFAAIGQQDRAGEVLTQPHHDIIAVYDEDVGMIAAAMATRPADEWESILNAARVPAARVRRIEEALASDQVGPRSSIQDFGKPVCKGGPSKLPVAAYAYAHDGPALDRPPPEPGQHNDEIYTSLGYSAAEIEAFRQTGVI